MGNEDRGEKRFLAHKGKRVAVCLSVRVCSGRGLSPAAVSSDISSLHQLSGIKKKHNLECIIINQSIAASFYWREKEA